MQHSREPASTRALSISGICSRVPTQSALRVTTLRNPWQPLPDSRLGRAAAALETRRRTTSTMRPAVEVDWPCSSADARLCAGCAQRAAAYALRRAQGCDLADQLAPGSAPLHLPGQPAVTMAVSCAVSMLCFAIFAADSAEAQVCLFGSAERLKKLLRAQRPLKLECCSPGPPRKLEFLAAACMYGVHSLLSQPVGPRKLACAPSCQRDCAERLCRVRRAQRAASLIYRSCATAL